MTDPLPPPLSALVTDDSEPFVLPYGVRKPAKKKKGQPEYRLQVALADLLRRACSPRIFWTAIDHGEERKRIKLPNGKIICPAADRAHRKGVKNGLPDFLFLLPPGALAAGLELKADKGKPTEAQEAMQLAWRATGGVYEFAYGWDEAIDFLQRWGIVKASSVIRPDRVHRPVEAA